MRVVVGDIHGELQKMKDLLALINDSDEYIFIGDYVDKGYHSYEVVDFLIDFSRNHKCIFLIGNHEFVWLKYLFDKEYYRKEFLLKYGSITFASSYLKRDINMNEFESLLDNPKPLIDAIPKKHLDFFHDLLPWYIPNGTNYFCVHAGVDPVYESYGMQNHPLERYLFVRKEFIYSKKLFYEKRIIFGHTACEYPYIDPYKIGIDTGATYEDYGILTAYDIDSGAFMQDNGVVLLEKNLIHKNRHMNPFNLTFCSNKDNMSLSNGG